LSSAAEEVAGAIVVSPENKTKKFKKFVPTLKKAPVKKQTNEEKLEQGIDETFSFYSR
jgi:hypothetical protein